MQQNSQRHTSEEEEEETAALFSTHFILPVLTCLDVTGEHNIKDALKNWKDHSGIKAYLFSRISGSLTLKKIFRPNLSRF